MVTTANRSLIDQAGLPGIIKAQPWQRTLARVTRELAQLVDLPAPLAVREGRAVLTHLTQDREFLMAQIWPILGEVQAEGPYVARRYEAPGGAYSLQVFVWPVGAQTQIHDHSCWGIFGPVAGTLHEERYLRLDEGARADEAHLRVAWRRRWTPDDGLSTLLPYAGGVHRVRNRSLHPAISIHVYGPAGAIDGRDYDPLRDYVCDRLTDDAPGGLLLDDLIAAC
jgi:predicted metal-dependent enzyme (double-stranded beta helix superfamily)